MPSTTAATSAAASCEKATIVAERFKTRLCKTFRKTGVCTYAARCMFAHGKDDLRTTELNVADRLTTENAVKNWQRAKIRAFEKAAKDASASPAAVATRTEVAPEPVSVPPPPAAGFPVTGSVPTTAAANTTDVPCVAADPLVAAFTGMPLAKEVAAATAPSPRRFRHDPYAQVSAWQPLHEPSSSSSSSSSHVGDERGASAAEPSLRRLPKTVWTAEAYHAGGAAFPLTP